MDPSAYSLSRNPVGNPILRPTDAGDRIALFLRPVLICFSVFAAMFYVVTTIHWVMAADSVVMHYVNFLMQHGLKPYVDISDNNMPGAYYTEGLAMRIFGSGDLAWRIYDFFLLTIISASLIIIAKPYDWLAGLFAAGLFLLIHGPEGPSCAVERDQMLTVMLLIGYAAMFTAVRRNSPTLMVIVGMAYGLAASIKPTFLPLPFALFALLAYVLWRSKMRILPFLLWSMAGFLVIGGLDLGYLLFHHALRPFFFSLHNASMAYVSMGRLSFRKMLALVLPRELRVLFVVVLATGLLLWRRRLPWTWEQAALALGAVFGLVSFFFQGKGYIYHRYTYLLPLLLLMAFVMLSALRERSWPRALAFVAFALILLYILPREVRPVPRLPAPNPLQLDLQRLGGVAELQDKVQCFDLVFGCFSALYHLKIVENTGFTGDLLFFSRVDSTASRYFKQMYWHLAQQDPATMLVISNEWYGEENSFDKLKYWPQFDTYVSQNYTLVAERRFAPKAEEQDPHKFRIYIRNGTPLLVKAQGLAAAGQL